MTDDLGQTSTTAGFCQWWCMRVEEHLWPQITSTLTLFWGEASVPLKPWPLVPSRHRRGSVVARSRLQTLQDTPLSSCELLCAVLKNVHPMPAPSHACFDGKSRGRIVRFKCYLGGQGELDQELQVAFMASWQVFFFAQCPAAKKRIVVSFRVSTVGRPMGDLLMP